MSAASVATVVKMMESLPDAAQERVTDHLREYMEELREEIEWEATFAASRDAFVAGARKARRETAAGLAKPVDPEQL